MWCVGEGRGSARERRVLYTVEVVQGRVGEYYANRVDNRVQWW
jgi:hypothetical protein